MLTWVNRFTEAALELVSFRYAPQSKPCAISCCLSISDGRIKRVDLYNFILIVKQILNPVKNLSWD